jgi:hypothetical protein
MIGERFVGLIFEMDEFKRYVILGALATDNRAQ